MKIKGLIGEPAAGKSTVMKKLIETLGEGEIVKEGLVVYTQYSDDKVMIAGKYEPGEVFCGTDKLSKGCGPKYREWLAAKCSDPAYADWTFYWEGERFSNSKFFDFFYSGEVTEPTIFYLDTDADILDMRNETRSNQNETWRKGMRTRMHNLRDRYPVTIVNQGFTFTGSVQKVTL